MPEVPRVDFDALLAALGEPQARTPAQVERVFADLDPRSLSPAPLPTAVPLDPHDRLARLEADLRAHDRPRPSPAKAEVLRQLETWLQQLAARPRETFKGR